MILQLSNDYLDYMGRIRIETERDCIPMYELFHLGELIVRNTVLDQFLERVSAKFTLCDLGKRVRSHCV